MHGGDNFLNNEQWRTLREILGGGGGRNFRGRGGETCMPLVSVLSFKYNAWYIKFIV